MSSRSKAPTLALLAVAVGVAGMFFWQEQLSAPRSANSLQVLTSSTATPQETTFPKASEIYLDGTVIGILHGGTGLAIRTLDGQLFQAYMIGDDVSPRTEGAVSIHGFWTGISCAYRTTVFEGQCTPEVNIVSITAQ